MKHMLKLFIKRYRHCRPPGSFLITNIFGVNKSLHLFYSVKSKSGANTIRKWICYSPKLDRCYCEPCWLFTDSTTLKNDFFNSWI